WRQDRNAVARIAAACGAGPGQAAAHRCDAAVGSAQAAASNGSPGAWIAAGLVLRHRATAAGNGSTFDAGHSAATVNASAAGAGRRARLSAAQSIRAAGPWAKSTPIPV